MQQKALDQQKEDAKNLISVLKAKCNLYQEELKSLFPDLNFEACTKEVDSSKAERKRHSVIKKYVELTKLQEILNQPQSDPQKTLSYFKAAYVQLQTRELLTAPIDSHWRVFLRSIAYVLWSILTLGTRPGMREDYIRMTFFGAPQRHIRAVEYALAQQYRIK